jgi:N-acetylglucosamine-6-phosphate deacetylase
MIRLFGHLYAPEDRGPCVVTVVDGRVASIEPAPATHPGPDVIGGPGVRLLPGLLDIQVNGAFGHDFAGPDADMDRICRDLPRTGVTGFAPTIVTSAPEAYGPALANLRRRSTPGTASILGTHIEGPFISPDRCGTHNPALVRLPDVREASAWLEAGDVAWLTIAPELPGAIPLIDHLVRQGVRVSIGHSDATWDQARAGADAGASLATHLFNAMRAFRHRDPGIAGFVMGSSLIAGVIADGHHVAFETIGMLARIKAPDELLVVTDALAGLGMPPGRYRLADREYTSDGTCGRLDDGTLSGSLLPLNLALRNLVVFAGLDPALAVRLVTLNPARALGLEASHGRVAVSRAADLVVVGDGWDVLLTVAGGAVAYRADDAAWAAAGARAPGLATAAGARA